MSDPGTDLTGPGALRGPALPPRPPELLTIHGVLQAVCRRDPSREALVFDDPLSEGRTLRWTYGDLATEARRVAAALLASGIGKGARIGVLLGNRPEAVATVFGAAMAGAVVVPLSTFSTRTELEHLLHDSDVSVLVTQTRLLARRFLEDIEAIAPPPLPCTRLPYLREVVVVGEASWDRFLAFGAEADLQLVKTSDEGVVPGDPALIIYTSGTTEKPKGILHSHGATAIQFWQQAEVFGRGARTRMWTALPMFWTAGFNTAMGATIASGGCWVMQETFAPGPAIELMQRERVTEPYTLPHQTAALVEDPAWEGADFSALRCVFGKSAFARHPTVRGDTGWIMPVGYGLSETGAFFSAHAWDAPREPRKHNMGRLLPGNELRVVDWATGAVLGAGAEGELALRGPTMMERYVKRERRECFDEDGFFHTGDFGSYDTGGYLHWGGRRSEMIKTAGANVSPAEIEVALRAFDAVKVARVLGLPDERRGQQVVLCAVLKEGASASGSDIRAFLAERVAAYKVPSTVLIVDEDEMPMTSSGTKVRDEELRALVEQKLGTAPT